MLYLVPAAVLAYFCIECCIPSDQERVDAQSEASGRRKRTKKYEKGNHRRYEDKPRRSSYRHTRELRRSSAYKFFCCGSFLPWNNTDYDEDDSITTVSFSEASSSGNDTVSVYHTRDSNKIRNHSEKHRYATSRPVKMANKESKRARYQTNPRRSNVIKGRRTYNIYEAKPSNSPHANQKKVYRHSRRVTV